MAEMNPANAPTELVRAALAVRCTHCSLTVGREPISAHEQEVRAILAAVLPLIQQRTHAAVAAELEAHAESIGWYEGGGVWAEALDVVQRGGDRG